MGTSVYVDHIVRDLGQNEFHVNLDRPFPLLTILNAFLIPENPSVCVFILCAETGAVHYEFRRHGMWN